MLKGWPQIQNKEVKKNKTMQMQRSSLNHWKELMFPTVKLKNLRSEIALEIRKDTKDT